jgi:hypothetical protein
VIRAGQQRRRLRIPLREPGLILASHGGDCRGPRDFMQERLGLKVATGVPNDLLCPLRLHALPLNVQGGPA